VFAKDVKCFRFHGFGHQSGNCSGLICHQIADAAENKGHEQKLCTADKDRCVACERAGIEQFEYKPESGTCKARKEALKAAAERNPHKNILHVASREEARSLQ